MGMCGYSRRTRLFSNYPTGIQFYIVVLYHITILSTILKRRGPRRDVCMIHKGVEFTVSAVAPGIWKWQFRIGDKVIAGKTEARLNLLAIRRVQLRIDRELKKAERK
jgi:hypothetical protein